MSNYNEIYFSAMKNFVESHEKAWRDREISNKQALAIFKDKRGEIAFFLKNNADSELKRKFLKLGLYVQEIIKEIKEEMKTIYIVKTDKNKLISVSDQNLLQKCLARLDADVEVFKMKVCETEEDLDILLDDKQDDEHKKSKIVHLCADKDYQLN